MLNLMQITLLVMACVALIAGACLLDVYSQHARGKLVDGGKALFFCWTGVSTVLASLVIMVCTAYVVKTAKDPDIIANDLAAAAFRQTTIDRMNANITRLSSMLGPGPETQPSVRAQHQQKQSESD